MDRRKMTKKEEENKCGFVKIYQHSITIKTQILKSWRRKTCTHRLPPLTKYCKRLTLLTLLVKRYSLRERSCRTSSRFFWDHVTCSVCPCLVTTEVYQVVEETMWMYTKGKSVVHFSIKVELSKRTIARALWLSQSSTNFHYLIMWK